MPTKQIIDQIRMGDRVTFIDDWGTTRTGKAVMYGPGGWVLNMGGAHGTPKVVAEEDITKVVRPQGSKSTLGTARLSGVRNTGQFLPNWVWAGEKGKKNPDEMTTTGGGRQEQTRYFKSPAFLKGLYGKPGALILQVDMSRPTSPIKFSYGGGTFSSTPFTAVEVDQDWDTAFKVVIDWLATAHRVYMKNPVGRSKNIAGFRDAMGIFHPIRSGVRQSYSSKLQRSVQRKDVTPYVEGTKAKKRKPAKKSAAKKRK